MRQRLDCLIDSGAKLAEIKAVAQLFSEAVGSAYDEAVIDLIRGNLGEREDES